MKESKVMSLEDFIASLLLVIWLWGLSSLEIGSNWLLFVGIRFSAMSLAPKAYLSQGVL